MTKVERFFRSRFATALIATAIGLALASLILLAAGYSPSQAIFALLRGTLGRPKYLTNVIIKATPILMTGVAVSFAYKTGLFNIGAEGQYLLGMICATMVGSTLNLHGLIQVPVVLLSGIIGGALLGAVIGFLKARLGIHEVIASIMFNWIVLYVNNFVCATEAFHRNNSQSARPVNPSSFTMVLPVWKKTEAAQAWLENYPWLKDALLKTNMNFGFLIAVGVAIIAGMVISRTKLGYELRAVGHNRDAARFAGISVERSIVLSMAVSGGIAGLAGALTVTGISPHAISTLSAQDGSGFNGLSVAFIAGCSTVGCIPASLLFSMLIYGGISIQQAVGAPSEIINIMIGIVVFCMALPGLGVVIADALAARRRSKQLPDPSQSTGNEG